MEISGDPAVNGKIDFYFKTQYIESTMGEFYKIPGFFHCPVESP